VKFKLGAEFHLADAGLRQHGLSMRQASQGDTAGPLDVGDLACILNPAHAVQRSGDVADIKVWISGLQCVVERERNVVDADGAGDSKFGPHRVQVILEHVGAGKGAMDADIAHPDRTADLKLRDLLVHVRRHQRLAAIRTNEESIESRVDCCAESGGFCEVARHRRRQVFGSRPH
jgi:hypothetical protein